MSINNHSKRLIASYSYSKGKEFIISSLLLRNINKRQTYPSIHLLLQGVEILLKSLLLRHDYNKYNKQVKTVYRHDIKKLYLQVITVFNSPKINASFLPELSELDAKYKRGELRYGGVLDIFILPETMKTETIIKKTLQLIKILDNRYKEYFENPV